MANRVLDRPDQGRYLWAMVGVTLVLAIASVTIGVYSLTWSDIRDGSGELNSQMVLLVSRIPRTVAIIVVGASTSISGMIMQMLSRNRFVSPSTAGTVESASLGILIITLLYPGAPLAVKILFATVVAMLGTGLFLIILRRIPIKSPPDGTAHRNHAGRSNWIYHNLLCV